MSEPPSPTADSSDPQDPAAARFDTPLDRGEARRLVDAVLDAGDPGDATGLETLRAWLAAAADRGETAEEIAGVAESLRARMHPVQTDFPCVADTCGTGGDGLGTFNISTAAAIVVAATGVPVAKHGNRAVSSRTGSADVLEALGVRVDLAPNQAAECLEELGLCFCLAPIHHPAMARVAAVRRSLGRPTVFNLVGPLCNPAAARVQVIGVGRRSARWPLATAAALLGLPRAVVVSGAIGGVDGSAPSGWLDEVSLFGPTDVIDARGPALPVGGGLDHDLNEPHLTETLLTETRWTPEEFGLATLPVERFAELHVDGAAGSAAAIREVLSGQDGARRDVVVLNAAALLRASATAGNAQTAREVAEEAIDSGRAARLLQALARKTQAFSKAPPTA